MQPTLLHKPARVLAHLLAITLTLVCGQAQPVTVEFQRVADGVYVHVGDTGARTADNEGLNANIGLVMTAAGSVLIDSGATFQSARQIAEAVRKVTAQPIRWVVNTGGQDHRWLGKGDFQAQGAELIAHAGGEADMRNRGNDHLQAVKAVLRAKADGTVPTLPSRRLKAPDERLELGGVVFEFRHRGGDTPGDRMAWLRQKNALLTGDVVYVDCMLGVIPVSSTRQWLARFAVPTFLWRSSWTSRYSAPVVPTARTPSR